MEPLNYIKNAIITGKYKPGMRLTEEGIANELNISRTPIREALKQLEADGLITPIKRGMIVREFTKTDIKQIYDLRALLESYAAAQAATYRTDEDINVMKSTNLKYRQIVEEMHENKDEVKLEEIIKANQQFHEAILTASRNDYLKFHMSRVVVLPLVFRSFYWYNRDEIKRSLDIHETILQAIINHETERAKIAMQEHIYLGRDHVLKHLSNY